MRAILRCASLEGMFVVTPIQIVSQNKATSSYVQYAEAPVLIQKNQVNTIAVPDVPFYSQFKDITSTVWQKVGCGVTSLAMVIDYYEPETISVNKLLKQAIAGGAYQKNSGWIHQGLVSLSKKYGLDGKTYDLSKLDNDVAFNQFKDSLKDGPVIVSIHYKFDVKNIIPHLVVINGIDGDTVYYNDPAAETGEKKISTSDFLKAWKKKFIVIRPAQVNSLV